jgi:Glycosyltransferase family 28 C-terminal domain
MPPGREASQHRAHSRSSLPGEATTRGQNWRREPTALGLPAILASLPVARGVEQTANARVLADAGASVLFPEAELTAEGLVDEVSGLLVDPDRRRAMAAHTRALATPDARSDWWTSSSRSPCAPDSESAARWPLAAIRPASET